jgi:hypothetical protein
VDRPISGVEDHSRIDDDTWFTADWSLADPVNAGERRKRLGSEADPSGEEGVEIEAKLLRMTGRDLPGGKEEGRGEDKFICVRHSLGNHPIPHDLYLRRILEDRKPIPPRIHLHRACDPEEVRGRGKGNSRRKEPTECYSTLSE